MCAVAFGTDQEATARNVGDERKNTYHSSQIVLLMGRAAELVEHQFDHTFLIQSGLLHFP
jgi:hypothetical protein